MSVDDCEFVEINLFLVSKNFCNKLENFVLSLSAVKENFATAAFTRVQSFLLEGTAKRTIHRHVRKDDLDVFSSDEAIIIKIITISTFRDSV